MVEAVATILWLCVGLAASLLAIPAGIVWQFKRAGLMTTRAKRKRVYKLAAIPLVLEVTIIAILVVVHYRG